MPRPSRWTEVGILPPLPLSGPSKAWLALGLLNEAVVAFSRREDLEDLWACVCEQARWLVPSQRMAVLTFEASAAFRVVQRFSRGTLAGPLMGLHDADADLVGALLAKPEAAWAEGPWPEPSDPFRAWLFAPSPPKSLLGVPIQYEGRRIGYLLFGLSTSVPEDQALLTGLASTFALHVGLRHALLRANAARADAERAREESDARLRLALRVARMALWEWESGTGSLVRSEGFDRIFGLPAKAADGLPETYLRCVHPGDLPHLRRAWQEDSQFDVTFRVLRPDGSARTLVSKGKILRGENGAPVQIIGALQAQGGEG